MAAPVAAGTVVNISVVALCCIYLIIFENIKKESGIHTKCLRSFSLPAGTVEELNLWLDPLSFFTNYIKKSKPVIFRNASKSLPAFSKWTDIYLRKNFGHIAVDVEHGKKENRTADISRIRLETFLDTYNSSDIYLVDKLHPILKRDFQMVPPLVWQPFHRVMQQTILWMSSGDTHSVLHFDSVDNINCVLDGRKDFYIIENRQNSHLQSEVIDEPVAGYSHVDVDAVDPDQYGALASARWWSAQLRPGDCVYLPAFWLHQVSSGPSRSLAVNVWFSHLFWAAEEENQSSQSSTDEQIAWEDFMDITPDPNEELRSQLLSRISSIVDDRGYILFNEFLETYEGNTESVEDVFLSADADGDGALTWRELYEISADEFVKLMAIPL